MDIENILKIRDNILKNNCNNVVINNKYALATIDEDGKVYKWDKKGNNMLLVKNVKNIEVTYNTENFEDKFSRIISKYI